MFLISCLTLLIVSLSIVVYLGYSINWARWKETKEIWLPEKYSITNKVEGVYIKVAKFIPSGSVNEISLEEYKRYFKEGSVTITADFTVYYWTEILKEDGKTTYLAFQKLTSSKVEELKPVEIEILNDRELELRFFDSGLVLGAFFATILVSVFGGFGLTMVAEKTLKKRGNY